MIMYLRTPTLPWSPGVEEDERFRRILKRTAILFLIFALVFPFLPLPQIERERIEEIPPRLAKLLLEREPPAPPAPVQAPKPEAPKKKPEEKKVAKETPKPKPVPKKTEAARAKAERSGLLAFKDELADLRQNPVTQNLQQKTLTQGAGKQARAAERSLITSNATAASGGINTASLSRDTGGSGLAGRATTQVSSPVGAAGGGSLHRGGGGKAARSIEEIKLVFDRNKGSIYTLYNRALRQDPRLQGKLVVKLTISPGGDVVAISLVSSELKAPDLERKLIARIKQFNFGAKDVGTMVVTYPIDFLPS